MEYRKLGHSDVAVSAVGLGCWALGGHGYGPVHERESVAAIRRALELGITLFDTADVYGLGRSEVVLSQALGKDRHHVVIASKGGVAWTPEGRTYRNCTPRYMTEALDATLRRLRVERVPLYQIHWPDGNTMLEDTVAALLACRDAGKLQLLGCSNFASEDLGSALHGGQLDTAQYRYSLLDRDMEPMIQTCAEIHGMGVLVYGVLGRGILSDKFHGTVSFPDGDTRSSDADFQGDRFIHRAAVAARLRQIGAHYGRSAADVAIRWALDQPGVSCAIVGAKAAGQVEENAAAADWTLPEGLDFASSSGTVG
jgi:myo-inositol catabolism protein IolS